MTDTPKPDKPAERQTPYTLRLNEGGWVARALEFDLIGTGSDKDEAIRQLKTCLGAQFAFGFQRGLATSPPYFPAPVEYWIPPYEFMPFPTTEEIAAFKFESSDKPAKVSFRDDDDICTGCSNDYTHCDYGTPPYEIGEPARPTSARNNPAENGDVLSLPEIPEPDKPAERCSTALKDALEYVESYLEVVIEHEEELPTVQSMKPLLEDVRKFRRETMAHDDSAPEAPAPQVEDWIGEAMREIQQRNRDRGHVLRANRGQTADVMTSEEMRAIIARHCPKGAK